MDYHRPAHDMMCVHSDTNKKKKKSFYEYESPPSILIAICDNLVLIQLLHMTLECQIKKCNAVIMNSNELLPQGVT